MIIFSMFLFSARYLPTEGHHSQLATFLQKDTEFLKAASFLIGDVRVDGARHLLFATDTQLKLLRETRRWFLD